MVEGGNVVLVHHVKGRKKCPGDGNVRGGIYLIHGRNVRIPTEAYSFCAICCVFTLDYQKKKQHQIR